MKFLLLTPPRINSSRLNSSLTAPAFLLLVLTFCSSGAAQDIQPRPAARLISDPVSDARYSRPRRVNATETSSTLRAASSSAAPSLEQATTIERRAFEKTNQARVENGLAPLTWDPELCRMARTHSEEMATLGFFSHETLAGLDLKERAHSMGIPHFRVIGENIAYNKGYDDPGAFAVERWMISSRHRANILYVGFQASAIGSYISTDGTVYLTEVFINR
ncbi:MAG TPA: hypothetical protein DCK99_02350 [Blastocatellia bacterium]|nr:hypothetical protein [Blastocatellia bacterium]